MSDLIKREDAIQALVDCECIRGYEYSMLEESLNQIPAVKALYICNRKRCEDCFEDCELTSDPEFAASDAPIISVADLGPKGEKKQAMIDISQKDFGTLCICALRYCHGRQTYMPSLVQSIVMTHFKDLSDNDLRVIADDEQFQSDMNLFGDMCDKVDWKNFYQILREWQKERSSE